MDQFFEVATWVLMGYCALSLHFFLHPRMAAYELRVSKQPSKHREKVAPPDTAAPLRPASGTPRGCRCAKGCAPAG